MDKIELNVENEADQRDQLENNATRLICLELSKVPKILNEPRHTPRSYAVKLLEIIGSENNSASLDIEKLGEELLSNSN